MARLARRPWTAADDELVRVHYPRPAARARLARHLARSAKAVRNRASVLGKASAPLAPWTPGEESCLFARVLPPGRSWSAAANRARALQIPGSTRRGHWLPEEDLLLYSRMCPADRGWSAALARARVLGLTEKPRARTSPPGGATN